jgi:hypothetical protein
MATFFYYIPVQDAESEYLRDELRRDLLIASSEWSYYQESMTGECSILITMQRPLSLVERRKIISCGLTINLGVEE